MGSEAHHGGGQLHLIDLLKDSVAVKDSKFTRLKYDTGSWGGREAGET